MIYRIFVFLFAALLCSCATKGDALLTEQNQSLGEIKKAVIAAIGDPRSVSENQRTVVSQYFGLASDKRFDPKTSKVRMYSRVTILGDRRPYDIVVDVIVEKKQGRLYQPVVTNPKEAQSILADIKKALHQSLEERNIIDDFRAF
jgi:hypothetical protein